MPTTLEELNSLSEEQKAALNKELTKQFTRAIIKRVAVYGAVALAAHLITKKLEHTEIIDTAQ